ncbi:hypothetical protein KP509_30G065500 [Ceratopteris richardii]|uniref:Protein kinase domain-containing protein n=1 Tax=Ceratopteris richardii TaxID=49495 RepID=A0A8T2R384_CERRI|nr:hypothetical protein KP509_30G065500 [Ceratopteris richardii]
MYANTRVTSVLVHTGCLRIVEMGNCLDFFSTDEPDDPLPSSAHLPLPACDHPNAETLALSSSSTLSSKHDARGFSRILPFSTPSDLAALYELGSELGRGQSGIVRRCTSRISGARFACKSIPKLRLRTIDDIKGIVHEINIMKRLSDRTFSYGSGIQGCNIAHLHEVVEESAFVHLIIELCNGGELFDRIIKVKRYSEARAAHLMKSLLETIKFCHGMGIIHRDLKPENILLLDHSDDSTIKLVDFGLALEFSPGQKFSGMAGSVYYMAPEVLLGKYSEEIDIWSAGVIMYVLLSGVPPFNGHTEERIFSAIQEGRLDFTSEPWSTISPEAKDLISRMLCVDVVSRCTLAQALEHPWIISQNTMANTSVPLSCTLKEHPDPAMNVNDASSTEKDTPCFDDRSTIKPHGSCRNLDPSGGVVLAHFCGPTALDFAQSESVKAELILLMQALLDGLEKGSLSLAEWLPKLRLQFGWTCTLLTTSALEETLLVHVGPENYVIAHDKLRKKLAWKTSKPRRLCRIDDRSRSTRLLGSPIQPVF